MNTRFKKWAGVVGAALVGVLAFSAISFAQAPDTSSRRYSTCVSG